jgi:hypothetical protein
MWLVSRLQAVAAPRRAVLEGMKDGCTVQPYRRFEGFTRSQRVMMVHLVPVLGKHDYLFGTQQPSVVFLSVVALVLSLEEELTWKLSRRKMMAG